MQKLAALLLLFLFLHAAPARAEFTVYAVPDGVDASGVWTWQGREVKPPASGHRTFGLVLRRLAALPPPVTVRLLVRQGDAETVYRRPPEGYQLRRWNEGKLPGASLLIEGQSDATGRPLTVFTGPGLKETICGALSTEERQLCERGEPVQGPQLVAAADMLNVLETGGATLAVASLRAMADVRRRAACLEIDGSHFIVLSKLGFRSCWLAAIRAKNSTHVTLKDSKIEGSTAAFYASTTGPGRQSSHFVLTGNHWIQTPRRIGPRTGCNPERDLDCPVDVWSEVPWGVTHDGFWDMLNGAFFGAKNIDGDVLIAGNRIENAYNGIRVKTDPARCRDHASGKVVLNRGFEIRDNTFIRIRDNPIEPENCADRWTISHNRFLNTHAPISTDGVDGGRIYIFGNVGWHSELPGGTCNQAAWSRLVSFDFDVGGFVVPDEVSDWDCTSHRRGTMLKALSPEHKERPVFLDAVYMFHNSWITRSPIFAERYGSPVYHWNNAVEFTGCGRDGAQLCRQEAERCKEFPPLWTGDSMALYADCFSLNRRDGKMQVTDFNGYNRPVPAALITAGLETASVVTSATVPLFPTLAAMRPGKEPAASDFALPPGSPLVTAGCRVGPAWPEFRNLGCAREEGVTVPIGAVMADGRLYDLQLPGIYRYTE